MRFHVWPRKGVDTSELQAHHCMTPEQWTWLLCSVSVIPENTVALQKFYQLIGIELLISCFLKNLGAKFQSPGGANARFHPLRTTMVRSDDDIFWKISAKCTNFEVSSLGLELQVSSLVSEFLMKSRSRLEILTRSRSRKLTRSRSRRLSRSTISLIAEEEVRQLGWCITTMVSQNLNSSLRTRRPVMYLGNESQSMWCDVNHAGERESVYCSVDTLFVLHIPLL